MPTPKLTDEQLMQALDAVAETGNAVKAAKKLKMSPSGLKDRLKVARERGMKHKVVAAQVEATKKTGRSLNDFRSEYDKNYIVPRKIKEALMELGEGWEYEVNFAKIAGVGLVDMGNYRDEFSQHIVVLNREGRRAWAGTVATAHKMREMIGR